MRWRVVPYLAALAVVLARLAFVRMTVGPDEAGFLAVAGQWRAGGSSLYGSYWVDRPPLLIALFQLASALGGVPALRLLGCVAAAVSVLALAAGVRRAAGSRAAAVASLVAGALLVSPLMGALEVNGELLAAPFIGGGLSCAVVAVTSGPTRSRPWAAVGAGACGIAALLVKQNMADVFVFAAVCWFAAWRTRVLDGRGLARLAAGAAAGGLLTLGIVGTWTLLHGSSFAGVFYAMYPFRLQAARVIAGSEGQDAGIRFSLLARSFAVSAVPLLLLVFGWLMVRRRLRGPVVWGAAATVAFALASVSSGGSYWTHYLVETVPAVVIAAGVMAASRPRTIWLGAVVAAVAVVAWVTALGMVVPATGTAIGSSLRRVAHPTDTIVSAFGSPDIVYTSGLRSPYPYLWSLPSRTLDPRMDLLRSTLAGPSAPVWVVVRGSHTLQRLRGERVTSVLARDYRTVGILCGRTVFLRRGATRPALDTHRCRSAAAPISTRQVVAHIWHDLSP